MRFKYVLNAEDLQSAIETINQPQKHTFWLKLKDALWTLVRVPKEKELVRIHTNDIAKTSTKEYLSRSIIDFSGDLKKQFAPEQRECFARGTIERYSYEAEDFTWLGEIHKLFPDKSDDNPFSFDEGCCCPLTQIEQFILDWQKASGPTKVFKEAYAENIFIVRGRSGPFLVSVKNKLGTWRMRPVNAGESFHSRDVYFFI